MMFFNKPLSQEISALLARLGPLVRRDEGLTADEVRDLCDWLKAAREKNWSECRAARVSAMALRQGENVVNLETINRKFQGHGDAPADCEPRGAA